MKYPGVWTVIQLLALGLVLVLGVVLVSEFQNFIIPGNALEDIQVSLGAWRFDAGPGSRPSWGTLIIPDAGLEPVRIHFIDHIHGDLQELMDKLDEASGLRIWYETNPRSILSLGTAWLVFADGNLLVDPMVVLHRRQRATLPLALLGLFVLLVPAPLLVINLMLKFRKRDIRP